MQALQIKPVPDEIREYLGKFDLNLCLTCGTCSSGCPITGTPGMEGWDTRKVLRMISFGLVDEVAASKFPWLCTNCGRCSHGCPMNIDIAPIMSHMKHLRPREEVPGVLHKGVEKVLETGNNMGIPRDDYLMTMADMGREMAEDEWPGFYVPVDKKNADILFFPNSKEVFGDFEDMKWWWKIFYAAKENWTIPSKNWEAVDWGLFSGNYEANATLARRKIELVKELGVKRMIMPDCGGGSYGCRTGMKTCVLEDPKNKIDFIYLYDYLKEIIEQGRIKLDKGVNAGKKFAWHDSCKHGRELERHFGKGYYDEPRWIIEQCVDDFVELTPNKANNYCCGAGGGMWPMPFEKESAYHGRFKVEQIKASKADVLVVGCSNCRDQIMKRLPKFYEFECEIKYIWELVADTLVFKPWSKKEAQAADAYAKAQWDALGVDLEAGY